MSRVILGMRDPAPSRALSRAIEDGRIGGLLWFRSALGATVAEAAARIARARALWPAGVPSLFAIDEEGGLIQQLSGLIAEGGRPWPRLPSPRALGRGGDARVVCAHGREVGRRIRILGLDVTLAPLVDLDPGPESAVLGTRCFGDDPANIAEAALSWLRGLGSAGIRGCIKHYPGHGATRVDSHLSLPRISTEIDIAPHLAPYERISRAWSAADGPPPSVLTAHIVCDSGGSLLPASLDPTRIAAIPGGLGPVFTDSLDMGALAAFGDLVARGRRAAEAGSDYLVIGIDEQAGLDLARALAPTDSARARAWAVPSRLPSVPDSWDEAAITRAAAAGIRLIDDRPIPPEKWDWILPEGFRAYGPIAGPPGDAIGPRRIARVIRYESDAPASLAAAFAASAAGARAARPALVGWIHRGPPDPQTAEVLLAHLDRVRAVAHLLDGPSGGPGVPDCWSIETCGFGEGELAALERIWAAAPTVRFAD